MQNNEDNMHVSLVLILQLILSRYLKLPTFAFHALFHLSSATQKFVILCLAG